MTEMPTPSTNRPTTNWAMVLDVEMMTIPTMMTIPPQNMPILRPYLSEMMAANGEPAIAPLQLC